MNSPRLIWLTLAAALAAAGCNNAHCGAGTVEQQQPGGSLACVPVAQPGASTPCDDVDGGTAIVSGGVCVSRVQCDPASTKLDPQTGLCVAAGSAPTCACPTPDASHICVAGSLFDLVGDAASTKNVRYAAYDPLQFLSNPAVAPLTQDENAKGCYVFAGLTPPSTGLLAIAVQDPSGTSPQVLEQAAVGVQVVAGQSYRVDVFAVAASAVKSWSTAAGTDFDAQGAYLGLFYDDPVPSATQLVHNEQHPLMGATLLANGAPASPLAFLGPTRDAVDPTLTTTGALGAALTPPPPGVSSFSGMGGQCTGGACVWEKHIGGSAPHTVFVERFHNCISTPMAPTCM